MHANAHDGRGGGALPRRLLCGLLLAAVVGAAANAASPGPDVRVHEDKGIYRVAARFEVPQPPAAVLAVLTDYEAIPRFMPDLRRSIVRERDGARVVIEQEAVSTLMFFSRRVHLTLLVHEADDAVRFTDVSKRSFSEYTGAWRLEPHAAGTVVAYELTAKPAFSVPEFVLVRLLKRDAHEMIDRLREAIAARDVRQAR